MYEDVAFVRAIQERPDDDTARLIYADWLEEQGDEANLARAEFLRADGELAGLAEEDEWREALEGRLRELAKGIDVAWRAAVSKAPIVKCDHQFDFQCPMQWDKLEPTEARSERFCGGCSQRVYYCATREEAIHHATCGNCVAVDARVVLQTGDLDTMIVAGMLADPSRPSWDRPAEEKGEKAPRRRRKKR